MQKNCAEAPAATTTVVDSDAALVSASHTFPIHPRVFSKPPLCVPEQNLGLGSGCALTRDDTVSSGTYAPTIPLGYSVPCASPPPSPLVGPLGPVLTDGRWKFRVEGLIASGTYGRVALASVVDVEPPAHVALKVYSKDQLIADPWLLDAYDLERKIMVDNTRNNTQWLVQSKGMFGDLWNRYLIMVSFFTAKGRQDMACDAHSRFFPIAAASRIITQTRFRASFSTLHVSASQGEFAVYGSKSSYVSLA
jgi:hypothetical protein